MSPILIRKLKLVALICAAMGVVAELYNLVGSLPVAVAAAHSHLGLASDAMAGDALPPHRHIAAPGDLPPFVTGAVLGLAFGVMELFALEAWGRRLANLPFGPLVLAKAALYTLVVFVAYHGMGLAVGYSQGKTIDLFWESLVSPDTGAVLLVTLASYGVLAFFVQINRMVGQEILMKFLRGRYVRPTQEERVFMFLDLKGSTTIAEKLGPTYYRLLNDFFHDLSQPVMMTRAEIYQYVGDEVVLTWELERGMRDANCVRVFSLINEAVAARAEQYQQEYGVTPEYKAGVHCGPVISAQIGDIKREIVYNGDVVNTTSRIQEMCGDLGVDLLVSGDVMRRLNLPATYDADDLGPTEIRGKEQHVELFSVRPT
jgi:adenylate cyclase